MTNDLFDIGFKRLFNNEGGFQKDPTDRGNWTSGKVGIGILKGTKYGISAMSYPHLDIADITYEQAREIYYKDWWVALGMARFRSAMTFQMFDAAVNHGMYNATKILQYAVKTKADGIIGPKTLTACRSVEINDLLMRFLAERLVFMTNVSTWSINGKGWSRRIAHNLVYATKDN